VPSTTSIDLSKGSALDAAGGAIITVFNASMSDLSNSPLVCLVNAMQYHICRSFLL
jgi:hypothetical protein